MAKRLMMFCFCLGKVALRFFDVYLSVIEVVAAKRTAARVRALEPPEQASRVEVVLASPTLLVWRLHIRPNNAVADGTLILSLQRALDVSPEGHQTFNQATR
jgi:hypothetical protein